MKIGFAHGLMRKLKKTRRKLTNAALAAVSVLLLIWLVFIWASPMPGALRETVSTPASTDKSKEPVRLEKASFDAIIEKDLFRPERRKYAPPVALKPRVKEVKAAVVVVPPPPPKTPPPKLMLVGTALVDNGNAAILDYNGPVKKGFYKVGDRIEEFVIADIKKDSVTLERNGEYIKYMMNQAAPVYVGGSQVYNPSMPQPVITLLPGAAENKVKR